MSTRRSWHILNRELHFEEPMIMGILNVTPDSFSDGGQYALTDHAIKQAENMLEGGAHIIDIGGESTRPGAKAVDPETELARVLPVIHALRDQTDALISIDTRKSLVASRAIDAGADIVNDVSGGTFDSMMFPLIAASGAGYILMHMQGLPESMQNDPGYANLFVEINEYFASRLSEARRSGIDEQRIVLDPGIGFGKTLEHNLMIMANMNVFSGHKRPLLLGASRKSFIGMIDQSNVSSRIGGSLAAVLATVTQRVEIYRVHDVAETVQALHIFNAIQSHSV